MTAQIRQLKREADPDVVGFLEKALQKAKDGEITGVLILAQDPSGVAYSLAGIKERFTVLGWLSHAMYQLQSDPE